MSGFSLLWVPTRQVLSKKTCGHRVDFDFDCTTLCFFVNEQADGNNERIECRVCGLPGNVSRVQGWPFLVGRKCLLCTEPAKTRIENVKILKICSPSKNANEAELYERFSQNLLDGRRKFCKKRNKHLRKRYKQPSYRNFYMRLFIGLNWFWETDITAPLL